MTCSRDISPGTKSPRFVLTCMRSLSLTLSTEAAALRGAGAAPAFDDPLEAVKQGRRLCTALPAMMMPFNCSLRNKNEKGTPRPL